MNPRPLKSRTHRLVSHAWVAVVLTAMMCGISGGAWALDCEGRLVSEGHAPWEVQAIRGEPTQVHDTADIVLQPVYDPFEHIVDTSRSWSRRVCGPITLGRAGSSVA